MKLAARLREWGVAHPAASSWLALVAVWTIAGVVFYWRFPNNLQYPNFYAEDGSVLTEGLLHHGFWGAVLALFNGYCIAGMYLLAQIGFWLNGLLYHGQLADLPKAYALVSYGFLGLVAALPVVLLRAYIGLGWRLLVALAVTVLPITNYDYAIIGVIGNFKYLFVPVAFMLVMYRIRLPRTSKRIWLADLGLLICLYTDAAVYLLLPALLLGDGLRPRQLLGLRGLPRRANVALWSAVVLGVLSLYQIYLVGRYGIPAIPGYLDEPLRTSPLLEIGVARSYLYPLVYWWYKHLNDVVSVGMLGLIVAAMWRWGRREHWAVYGVGLAIIAVATGLFVANRTGVTALFNKYVSPGP
ncbi:MAG TPA: hypothetical protein VLF67_02190, partial [Candidatus Saccharimonas sp.]|nr:hypothetical protein [Candidatus Saccharimonas sp.]